MNKAREARAVEEVIYTLSIDITITANVIC